MSWVVTTRNYHGLEPEFLRRWMVHRDGETQAICECYSMEGAERIAAAGGGCGGAEGWG